MGNMYMYLCVRTIIFLHMPMLHINLQDQKVNPVMLAIQALQEGQVLKESQVHLLKS